MKNFYNKRLFLCLLALAGIISITGVAGFVKAQEIVYNPAIHVYEEGMQSGVMGENIRYGTLESLAKNNLDGTTTRTVTTVPQFDSLIQPMAVEQGSWFYPAGDKNIDVSSSNVRWNSCGGGDDAWVDFYYINETELWSNDIVVWASNWITSNHISRNNGLNGGYYCVGGACTISVCSTQLFGSNPSSVRISYN